MSITHPRFENALYEAIAKLGADSGTIHVRESNRNVLHLAASHDIPDSLLEHIREIPWGKGLAGVAAERAEPVNHCNLVNSGSPDIHPRAKGIGVRGAVVVPMINGTEVVGTIGVGCRSDRTFTKNEIGWLLAFARRLAGECGENRMAA